MFTLQAALVHRVEQGPQVLKDLQAQLVSQVEMVSLEPLDLVVPQVVLEPQVCQDAVEEQVQIYFLRYFRNYFVLSNQT